MAATKHTCERCGRSFDSDKRLGAHIATWARNERSRKRHRLFGYRRKARMQEKAA